MGSVALPPMPRVCEVKVGPWTVHNPFCDDSPPLPVGVVGVGSTAGSLRALLERARAFVKAHPKTAAVGVGVGVAASPAGPPIGGFLGGNVGETFEEVLTRAGQALVPDDAEEAISLLPLVALGVVVWLATRR